MGELAACGGRGGAAPTVLSGWSKAGKAPAQTTPGGEGAGRGVSGTWAAAGGRRGCERNSGSRFKSSEGNRPRRRIPVADPAPAAQTQDQQRGGEKCGLMAMAALRVRWLRPTNLTSRTRSAMFGMAAALSAEGDPVLQFFDVDRTVRLEVGIEADEPGVQLCGRSRKRANVPWAASWRPRPDVLRQLRLAPRPSG